MPIDYSKYPSDWKAISKRIRERGYNRCEVCGVENHRMIVRFTNNPEKWVYLDDEAGMYWNAEALQDKAVKVVLTVAHLNHDTTDNRDCNLKSMCNRCHLTYDAKHHAQNASKTRRAKKREKVLAGGQLELFGGGT